jgi:type I restriction enzyme, S subunit
MEQQLYELPEGWEWKPLGIAAEILGGGTPKTKIPEYWGGEIVWLSPTDLPPIGEITHISDSMKKITEIGLAKSSARLIPEGSVIFSSRATIGKIAITDCPLATNQGFTNFICPDNLLNRYLAYVLVFLTPSIASLSNSTTFKEVSKTNIKGIEIPIPPINEQKRIVAKLDALFIRIDTAITHLQQTLKLSKALFASTLKAEVSGDGNDWPVLALSSLGEFSGGGTPAKSRQEYWDGGIPWITPKDMKSPELTDSEMKITPLGVAQSSAKMLPENSVLIVARSGILRHTLPVCINRVEATVNQDIKVFIPSKRVSPEYMQYLLKGNESFILQQLVKGGVTVESLKYKEFQSHSFPIPSIEKQNHIVTHLDALSERIRALETYTQEKLNDLTALKASLLDAAFKGQL